MLTSDVITAFHPFSYQINPKVGESGSEMGLQISNSQNLPCMHSSSVDTGLGGAALFVLCEILCLIERKGCEILYLFILQNQ